MSQVLTLSLQLGAVVVMPQRVACQGCGHVLYDGPELRPPDEILHEVDGKCPNCGKKLSLVPIDVEVKPAR